MRKKTGWRVWYSSSNISPCKSRWYEFTVSANFEQVEETCHHEYFLDVVIDMLNDDLATLGSSFLAERQKQAQTGTADVFKAGTVEYYLLVGILQ